MQNKTVINVLPNQPTAPSPVNCHHHYHRNFQTQGRKRKKKREAMKKTRHYSQTSKIIIKEKQRITLREKLTFRDQIFFCKRYIIFSGFFPPLGFSLSYSKIEEHRAIRWGFVNGGNIFRAVHCLARGEGIYGWNVRMFGERVGELNPLD